MFCKKQRNRTQTPPIRHPWLSGGLFEHRVQTLLITYRTLRISKLQTYSYNTKLVSEYIIYMGLSASQKISWVYEEGTTCILQKKQDMTI